MKFPLGCPSSTLSAHFCLTAYSWCPFNLSPCPSDILSPPLSLYPHQVWHWQSCLISFIWLQFPTWFSPIAPSSSSTSSMSLQLHRQNIENEKAQESIKAEVAAAICSTSSSGALHFWSCCWWCQLASSQRRDPMVQPWESTPHKNSSTGRGPSLRAVWDLWMEY